MPHLSSGALPSSYSPNKSPSSGCHPNPADYNADGLTNNQVSERRSSLKAGLLAISFSWFGDPVQQYVFVAVPSCQGQRIGWRIPDEEFLIAGDCHPFAGV